MRRLTDHERVEKPECPECQEELADNRDRHRCRRRR